MAAPPVARRQARLFLERMLALMPLAEVRRIVACIIVIMSGLTLYAAVVMARDIKNNWSDFLSAPGSLAVQLPTSFVIFFFNAFGISDFAVSTVVYTKTNWVDTRQLPGTLNTQALLALSVMAISYIITLRVELITLVPFMLCHMLGGYLGPRKSVRLKISLLKYLISASLTMAGVFILLGKLGLTDFSGAAMGVSGWKLVFLCICGFCFGYMKTLGIGSYPLIMGLVALLGMHPLAAYPLMMGASALSIPLSSLQFIKFGAYSRRMAFCSCLAGTAGALAAIFIVRELNVSILQWLLLAVVFYAAVDLFLSAGKLRRQGN